MRKILWLLVSFVVCAFVFTTSTASAQSLGSAQNFAVLGATTVTNTGPSVVTGNLGVSPGTAITGFPPGVVVGGTVHKGDFVAAQAQADAHLAYAALKAMPCPPSNNLTGQDLGTLSLPPGVYCFSSSAQLTGTLFLTGAGPWVFQIGSTLTTASDSRVVINSPAPNCGSKVFWQIGSSATLGTRTQFVGNILALASITLTTNASVSGSAVALTAAVTMDTNRVSVCTSSSGFPPPVNMCEVPDDHHGDHHGDNDHHHGGDHGDHDHKNNDDRGRDNDRNDHDRGHDDDRNGHDSKGKKW